MNINELMKISNGSERQLKFISIHQNILNSGSTIANSVISIAKNLKIMKEEKLYLEADCETFEEYAEKLCGLKRSQAYSYISVLDKLGDEFVQLTGQIGISKLTLLSSTTEDNRECICQNIDVDSISVKKLKSIISDLESKNKLLLENNEKLNLNNQDLMANSKKECSLYLEKINSLENQLKKMNSVSDKKIQITGQNEELKILQDKISEFQNVLQSKDNIINVKSKYLEDVQRKYDELKKQFDINSSTELVEFKLKFDEFQRMIIDINQLILKIPEEKQSNCKLALKKVVELLCL